MRAKEYILDEVFTRIKNGVSIKQIKGGAGIPITRIETIANRYVDDTKFGYADIEDDKYSDSYLKNGDILLSHINSLKHIGKTALFEGFPYDVIHGMNLVGLRPDEKKVIPQYAFQFFQTDHFYKQILKFVKKSVNQVSVPVSAIKKIKIPLPSLDDQKRIAYLLTRCEELIGKRKESITLLDDYVKSVFLEMFGDPVINTKNYKKTELQNVANVISGFPFKSNRYSNKKDAIKICGGLIISPNRIVWEDAKKWEVTNSENLDQYYLNANDIVMALDRPWITSGFKIGKIEDNDLPSLLIQRTARIRSESFRYQFIYYSLKDRSFRFHCNPTETTVPHISLTELKKFELLDVPLTEQNQFAAIVEKVEKIKTNHESSLQELENLYGSLSQKAFMDPTLKLRISEENLDSSSSFKLQVAKGDLDVSELYELKNETGDVFAEHDILEVEIDKDYAVGKPLMNITVRNHILIKIGDSSKLINSGILNPEKWIKKTIDQICEFHFIKSSYADIILDEEKPKEDQLNNKIRQEFLSKALSIGLVVQQHMVIPLIEGLNLRDGGLLNSENSYRTRDSEIDINIQFIINFKIKNFNKNSRKLIRPGIDPIRILEQIVDGAIEKEMHQIEASKALLFNVSYDSESSEQTCEEILKDAIKDSLSSYGIESADIILKANQEEITQRFNELSKRTYQVELSIIPKIRDNYSEKVDFKLEYRIAGIVPEKLNVFFNRKFSDIQEEQDDLMNTIRNDLTAKFQDLSTFQLRFSDSKTSQVILNQVIKPVVNKINDHYGLIIDFVSFRRKSTEMEDQLIRRNLEKKKYNLKEVENRYSSSDIKKIAAKEGDHENDLERDKHNLLSQLINSESRRTIDTPFIGSPNLLTMKGIIEELRSMQSLTFDSLSDKLKEHASFTYEEVKKVVFNWLEDDHPWLTQFFDEEEKVMKLKTIMPAP